MKRLLYLLIPAVLLMFGPHVAAAQGAIQWLVIPIGETLDTIKVIDHGWRVSALPGGTRGRPSLDTRVLTISKSVDANTPLLAQMLAQRTVLPTAWLLRTPPEDVYDNVEMTRVQIGAIRNGAHTRERDPNIEYITLFFTRIQINGGTPK